MLGIFPSIGFDADGVVLDSQEAAWLADEDIAALFGPRPTITTRSGKLAVFGPEAQAALAGEDAPPVLRSLHRLVMRHRTAQIGLFEDVLAVAKALPEAPVLITAGFAEGVRRALGSQAGAFASIIGREQGSKEQLLAEAALRGMRWFVCDTRADIRRCKAAGLGVVAVAWGYDAASDLRRAGADHLAVDPWRLADVLGALRSTHPSIASPGDS